MARVVEIGVSDQSQEGMFQFQKEKSESITNN